jgi:hypothetical protein
MNALDCVPTSLMASTRWPEPRKLEDSRRLGIFVGASEDAKRPDVDFYARLADGLVERNMRPVLFGGPGDVAFGSRVAQAMNHPVLDMCGKLSLAELARAMQTLGLFVTPDTGPMHLAAWTGTRVLNLSLGPVNPWETGPFQPGHHILRTSRSCRGCWSCRLPQPACSGDFRPTRVAALAARLAERGDEGLDRMQLPGLRLLRTARTRDGLYDLELISGTVPQGREPVSRFWREWFGALFGLWDAGRARDAGAALAESRPDLADKLRRQAAGLVAEINSPEPFADPEAWSAWPPLVRPLSSWLERLLANDDRSRPVRARALEAVDFLLASLV